MRQAVIIGAGPAGLTAAYELALNGRQSVVLEADDQVGGLSKTAFPPRLSVRYWRTQVFHEGRLWLRRCGVTFLGRT